MGNHFHICSVNIWLIGTKPQKQTSQLYHITAAFIKDFKLSVAAVKAYRVETLARKAKKQRGFCGTKGKKDESVDESVKLLLIMKMNMIDISVNNHDVNSENF